MAGNPRATAKPEHAIALLNQQTDDLMHNAPGIVTSPEVVNSVLMGLMKIYHLTSTNETASVLLYLAQRQYMHPYRDALDKAECVFRVLNMLVKNAEKPPEDTPAEERIRKALTIAADYGQIDGAHHKAWVIDQIVRLLTGSRYDEYIGKVRAGEDGSHTYSWDTGIAP